MAKQLTPSFRVFSFEIGPIHSTTLKDSSVMCMFIDLYLDDIFQNTYRSDMSKIQTIVHTNYTYI